MKASEIITQIARNYEHENRWARPHNAAPTTHDYLFAIMDYLDESKWYRFLRWLHFVK